MIDIPVDATVECTDGPSGKSIAVIVDPKTHRPTHFVVEDETLTYPPYQRLVPVDQVLETTRDQVRLRCTRNELTTMEPFVETHYIPREGQDYTLYRGGEYQPSQTTTFATYRTVDEEHIPEGELAVRPGTRVEATDGHIGHMGELLADEETGELSHLVLQEGHLWGKKEVMIPAVAVDRAEGDAVYLKLDKAAVEQLPAVPVRRHRDKDAAEPEQIELVARVFDDQAKATEALEYVEELHQRHIIKILNAAVLVKGEDGTISVRDRKEMEPKKGRLLGAITGGLIGLVGGPVGVVVGALTGAATGGLAARWIDMGFSDKFLAGLEEHMKPGSSVLIVLAEHRWRKPMSESMAGLGGVVFQQTLTDELAEELLRASEAEE